MADNRKAFAKKFRWSVTDSPPEAPETGPEQPGAVAHEQQESTKEKALDRWFYEQRNNKRVVKRLDIANELLVTNGGPLKLTGNITLIDEDGKLTHSNSLSLCRCGATSNRPLCDNRHLDAEFLDNGSIDRLSDVMPIQRPQTITVTCVKNGPLKFRGYLRVYNRKGQECITMEGALCRCGKSSKKPFCDSSNGCNSL